MSLDSGCDSEQLTKGLISAKQALTTLLEHAKTITTTETINTYQSLGRVLAEPCISSIKVPPLDNSAMDGYALLSADSKAGDNCFPISQRICAGEIGDKLQRKTMARIFTGAPIPNGADAVIMQEQVEEKTHKAYFSGTVPKAQNVRKAGEDIGIGDEVVKKGTRIRAQEMGLLASVGAAKILVYTKLKVAVFFTGDELVEAGDVLPEGKIYNSNRFTLLGLLKSINCDIVDLGNVEDTLHATRNILKKAANQADLVITTGGVSVGDEDHVRIALEELGTLTMWRVAMKPGKPLAFGFVGDKQKTPFIGLPGNPVSAFATFQLYAAAFIKKQQGITHCVAKSATFKAGFEIKTAVTRQEYKRAKLVVSKTGQTQVDIFPHQGSGVLTSTSWADGFVIIPIGKVIKKGDAVHYLAFNDLL